MKKKINVNKAIDVQYYSQLKSIIDGRDLLHKKPGYRAKDRAGFINDIIKHDQWAREWSDGDAEQPERCQELMEYLLSISDPTGGHVFVMTNGEPTVLHLCFTEEYTYSDHVNTCMAIARAGLVFEGVA